MKTGIVIITFNLEVQVFVLLIENLTKFCMDDFTIEIFDNSNNADKAAAIEYHCRIREINYKKTNAQTADASGSHSFAANLSYQVLKDKYDLFFYLDHDCVPVKEFSCEAILGQKLIAGVLQAKAKTYIWPGCFIFKKEVTPVDFSFSREFQLDTGGNLYKLVEKYGRDNIVEFKEEYLQNEYYQREKYNYLSVINHIFFHCIAGSNWVKIPDNVNRINAFINKVKDAG